MLIRTLSGDDDINNALTGAMNSTVKKLAEEGYWTQEKADEFLATHFCLAASKECFITWFKRRFASEYNEIKEALILVVKV